MKRHIFLLVSSVIALGCGPGEEMDASVRDARMPDAGTFDAGADSGVDASRPDAGFTPWDGVTVPAVEWELPGCVETYGVLERGDDIPGFGPAHVAANSGLAAIAWR